MTYAVSKGRSRWPERLARYFACLAGAVGVVGVLGYATATPALARGVRTWVLMPPLTCAELTIAGTGLLLMAAGEHHRRRHRAGRAAGGLVAAIAAMVLVEYASGLRLVDGVLFPGRVRSWAVNSVPGRPSLHMVIGLLLVGVTLVVLDTQMIQNKLAGRLLVPATLLVGATAPLGELYGAAYVRRGADTLPGTSLLAGVALLSLGIGIMLSRPHRAPGDLFIGRGPGSRTMRGLAPWVTTILVIAVLLTAAGRSSFPLDGGLAATAATGLVITSLYLLFQRAGAAMDAADRKLRDERDYVRTVLDSLREGVVTVGVDGRIVHVTPRWCQMTGYSSEETIGGGPPFPWWPPDQVAAMTALMARQLGLVEAEEIDVEIVRRDGTRVDVLLTVCPVGVRDGDRLRTTTYRDLTERKATEAERQRMVDQVDHFFELSGDLLCIVDRNGRFLRLNPAWEQTLGFTLGELISRPYLDFVHPDDRERTTAYAEPTVAAGARMTNFENRLRCRDGSYRWLNWTATLADGGSMTYCVARDMTAQREAERNQAFLAAIVSSTDDAVIGKTLDGTILSWNAAAEQMYGYAAAEAVGRSIQILTLPGQFEEIDEILARVREGESVVRADSLRRRADGTRLRVSLTMSPVRDQDGLIVGAASIARDVTAQVAAEQRFRRLVQTAPDAMIIVDGTGRIALANDQTGRLFGYPSDDLLGVPVEHLVPAGARERHVRHREGYVAAPHKLIMGSGMELCGLRRDGTEFPIEISLAPLQTDEGIMISGAIRDISRRREVEQALAHARDDALAAAKLKSQFVAMVSHEIRTPMNGVIGLTGLLLGTGLNAEQERYAEAIRTSGRALLTIINDILDFSKIEAGKINIVVADFDLPELLDTVTDVAAEAVGGKDIEVICYYLPVLPTIVRGDDGRLRQALLNLVGNAVKFTPRGNVVLWAEPASPAPDGTPRITFAVTDSGVGIASHHLPRLFEPFTQADADTSREYGGTGLGLTISRQFVELMGGSLTAESTLGEGSRFAFTIPLPAGPVHAQQAPPSFVTGHALVIDSDPIQRRLVVEHIRSWGLSVTEAAGGQEAVARFRYEDFEFLIVNDRALIADDRLAAALADTAGQCRVVVLTGALGHTETLSLGDAGAHLLTKPVGVRRLWDCLFQECAAGTGPQVAETSVGRADPVGGGRIRVLLAEDNKINQMVAEDLLDLLGFDCDLAQNGTEVLSLTASHSYRAILMDCQMPKMDGYAATAALRGREAPGQHVPIIAMTAGAMAEDRELCLAAGMDDYLAKPIDPQALRAALERWTTDAESRPGPA